MSKKERRQVGRIPATLTNGGFRAGKRKRGNSLLRKQPKDATSAVRYYMIDADGNTIGSTNMIVTKPE